MNSSCQHVLCGLVDFSKKLPDNIVKVRKGMTFFVERSALYSLSILKLLFFVSVNSGAKKNIFLLFGSPKKINLRSPRFMRLICLKLILLR